MEILDINSDLSKSNDVGYWQCDICQSQLWNWSRATKNLLSLSVWLSVFLFLCMLYIYILYEVKLPRMSWSHHFNPLGLFLSSHLHRIESSQPSKGDFLFVTLFLQVIPKKADGGDGGGGALGSGSTGARRYQCPYCNYSSFYKHVLRDHIYTHTGYKPYQCLFCPKKCSTKTNLKLHTRQHTGEKPYRCSLCSYACSHSASLKYHMKSHKGS